MCGRSRIEFLKNPLKVLVISFYAPRAVNSFIICLDPMSLAGEQERTLRSHRNNTCERAEDKEGKHVTFRELDWFKIVGIHGI